MPFTPLTATPNTSTPTAAPAPKGFTPLTKESLASMPIAPTQTPPANQGKPTGGTIKNLLVGAAKGAGQTAVETAKLMQNVTKHFAPEGSFFNPSQKDIQNAEQNLTPQGTAQQVGRGAETFTEYLAGGLEKGGVKVGETVAAKVAPTVGKTVSKYAGKTLASVLNMYGYDTASKLKEGAPVSEAVKPDTTDLGVAAAIPAIAPVTKAIGAGTRELIGATTGTGGGVIGKAWEAAQVGGDKLKAFKEGLTTEPEQIVSEARDALGTVINNRNTAYRNALEKISGGKSYDLTPVVSKFKDSLQRFGVQVKDDGSLDFSRSPALGRYEGDVKQMWNVIKDWGSQKGDRTLVGVDKLKQTLADFRRGSSESVRFDSFVKDVKNAARGIGLDNPTYEKMLKDYESSTGVIKEIQRSLSLGDKASVDTAFRKLTSALRTNNEFRANMIKELDDASGGFLSSKIAGQQMNEILPRGLARTLEAFGTAVGAGALGTGIVHFLPAAIFSSPRAVQRMIRALGIPAKYTGQLFKAIEEKWTGKF